MLEPYHLGPVPIHTKQLKIMKRLLLYPELSMESDEQCEAFVKMGKKVALQPYSFWQLLSYCCYILRYAAENFPTFIYAHEIMKATHSHAFHISVSNLNRKLQRLPKGMIITHGTPPTPFIVDLHETKTWKSYDEDTALHLTASTIAKVYSKSTENQEMQISRHIDVELQDVQFWANDWHQKVYISDFYAEYCNKFIQSAYAILVHVERAPWSSQHGCEMDQTAT